MTIKALLNFGGFNDGPSVPAMDRYHGGGGGGHGHYESHGWHKSKGKGGSGAALSALTLLAFLFLMNVMQQSLMENNATETTTATTIFLREESASLASRNEDKSIEKDTDTKIESTTTAKKEPKKEMSYIKLRKPPT